MTTFFNRRVVQKIFQSKLIPWTQSRKLQICIPAPDWELPESVTIVSHSGEYCVDYTNSNSSPTESFQVQHELDYRPYPIVLFVLEGSADIRIGRVVGRKTRLHNEQRLATVTVDTNIYSLNTGGCMILPPDTGHSSGTVPHWERGSPEKAHSVILWLSLTPMGAIAHTCETKGASHTHSMSIFIRDLQTSLIAQFMLDRTNQSRTMDELEWSMLYTILLSLYRNLQTDQVFIDDRIQSIRHHHQSQKEENFNSERFSLQLFDNAYQFIDSQLASDITPAQIAKHIGVSGSQLKRMFHARHGQSVMKYITRRRVEEAESLLANTQLSTEDVAKSCGYSHRTHFSRVFKQQTGLSPLTFRRQVSTAPQMNSQN